MRIVIIGDKSRYQILRMLVSDTHLYNSKTVLRTEALAQQSIEIVSDAATIVDEGLYKLVSRKLPLHTRVLFPKEGAFTSVSNGINDRWIVFDEFPYRTDEETRNLKNAMQNYTGICDVVLFKNSRRMLDSDVSTEEEASKEALESYRKEGYQVFEFEKGGSLDFLFWSCRASKSISNRLMERQLNEVKENIECFSLNYELSYMLELKNLVDNPVVLKNLVKYEKNLNSGNVMKRYSENADKYFMVHNYNKLESFVKSLYFDCVKNICIWNIEKDFNQLMNSIVDTFRSKLSEVVKNVIAFNGDEGEYVFFTNKNQKHIIKFKEMIIDFFANDLCEILSQYIENRIGRLEALLNE